MVCTFWVLENFFYLLWILFSFKYFLPPVLQLDFTKLTEKSTSDPCYYHTLLLSCQLASNFDILSITISMINSWRDISWRNISIPHKFRQITRNFDIGILQLKNKKTKTMSLVYFNTSCRKTISRKLPCT
jgi:hypothetical protein